MYRMGWGWPDLCATPDSIVQEALAMLEVEAQAQGGERGDSLRAARALIRDREAQGLTSEG